MPWFPDFVSAVELARKQTRDAGLADPAAQYFEALNRGETHLLETVWPGEVVVYDPRAGEIHSHRRLHRFISDNHSWFAARHARIETVASTAAGGRAVLELLAHVSGEDGQEIAWPVAVVAESPDDLSVVFRTYCSQWPVERRRPVRPAILPPGDTHPGDVIARYQAALDTGDADAIVNTFAPDGYYREPIGPHPVHRGTTELRSFFTARLSGGGIGLQDCAVTDDGVRCALEYNCIRWGRDQLPPQAGLAVYDRTPDGLLAAIRAYDDVEPPG
jgi:SnoaL-like domain